MIEFLFVVISLLLVLACGIFVAAEFAFVTVDRSRVERLARNGDRRAAGVLSGLRTLSTQLSGAQIGITITNLAIGLLAEPAVASLLREPLSEVGVEGALLTTISFALAIAIATIFTMLFGELVPKNLAITRPVGTAKKVQAWQRSFTKLMHYPILLTNGTANFILRRFMGIKPQEELASARSVDELLSVVKHSARRGALAKDTAVLLERSLEFGERHVSDVMTPRVKLSVVQADSPVTEVIEAVKKSGFSRFPVINKEIDNVVGIIHIKDAVAVPFDKRKTTKIKDVMQTAVFAPSSIELDALIERLREEGTEIVVAIDEFGGVDGLVTLEDLIEELVGEVKDEHDEAGVAIQQLKSRVWSVSGLLRPDEISQIIGLTLPEDEEFETIGGLVLDQWEEVPKLGDEVLVDALDRDGNRQTVRLKVTCMDGRRIDRIEITQLKQTRSDS
jgi:CBS domain containing-hemolysin-like protein